MSDSGVWTAGDEAKTRIFASDAGKDALTNSVRMVQITLQEVCEHERLIGAGALVEVQKTLAEVDRRLSQEQLVVVVVGERGSGKSTLLDAIVGDRVLGGARGQFAIVTLLRRRAVPSFRARLSSGAVEDFSRLVPDTASERVQAGEQLAQSMAEVEQRCRSLRSELRRAIEAKERADRAAEQARSGVAGAREIEDLAGSELNVLEDDALRLQRALSDLELSIPHGVRSVSPRWVFWQRLLQAMYRLFRRTLWRRYQALLGERAELHQRLLLRRERAREAAEARALAEAGLEPVGSGADEAQLRSSEVEHALRQAEAERDRLRAELEELRSEVEHRQSERFRQFFGELQALSRRSDVVELTIDYPAKLLPDDVTIVDIPGLVSDSDPAWQLIREQADGCILVSELDRAVSQAAKQFLRQLREVVPHVLLVLTKIDQAFDAAVRRGARQPWDEVELARRIGTRRFARELGRDASSVLSISVAAEAVFGAGDSELADRFDAEIEKLFLLLRRERALIIGARAGEALRRCVGSFVEAEANAERSYRERIATLEQQRTPEPDVFKQQLLAEAELAVEAAALEAVARARAALEGGFSILQRLCEQEADACAGRKAALALAERFERELPERVLALWREARLELESVADRELAKIEQRLFQKVRSRYQLLHEIRRMAASSPQIGSGHSEPAPSIAIASQIREQVRRFERQRMLLGASGALVAAAGGALAYSWLGSALGALVGGLSAFIRRERAFQQQVSRPLLAAVAEQRAQCLSALSSESAAATAALRLSLERSLERALLHFARWIAEPLEAERQAIEAERDKLVQLESLRDRVSARDRELEDSLRAATLISVGLCR
jgi:GTPase SAR1 family protein